MNLVSSRQQPGSWSKQIGELLSHLSQIVEHVVQGQDDEQRTIDRRDEACWSTRRDMTGTHQHHPKLFSMIWDASQNIWNISQTNHKKRCSTILQGMTPGDQSALTEAQRGAISWILRPIVSLQALLIVAVSSVAIILGKFSRTRNFH